MKKFLFPLLLIFLFHTTARAEKWIVTKTGTNKELRGIHFPTSNIGYASGRYGTLLKTTDGGQTWNIVLEGASNSAYESIWFTDTKTGFLSEDSHGGLKTTDGGITWDNCGTYKFYGIYFFNSQTGFIGTGATIYKTKDGGKTWVKKIPSPNGTLAAMRSFAFIDSQTGFAVGSDYEKGVYKGLVLKTTDGGETWTEQEFGKVDAYLCSVSFPDKQNGYIVGGEYYLNGDDKKGILFRTKDGGKTWSKSIIQTEEGTYHQIRSAAFMVKGTGYLSSNGYIYKTTDDGITWEQQVYDDRSFDPTILYFRDKSSGFAVGHDGKIARLVDDTPIDDAVTDAVPGAFPNPARGTVTLPFDGSGADGTLRIFNAGGQLVKEVRTDGNAGSVTVDVSDFERGLYFFSDGKRGGKFSVE
ncbi:MAG: YCF48-related protein [Bacteroidales bacterium]|nr:YCF48-related protein [Bacteroidales bacterium]